MTNTKTTHKSKPAKKTAHNTFHKHPTEEPVAPSQESASQTVQPASETVIPPVIQPEPESEATPTSPQPEPIEEDVAPASTTTPPPATNTIPTAVSNDPAIGDANNTPVNTNNPSPTMTPEKQRRAEPQSTSPIIDQEEGKSKKPIIIIAVIIILIALASGYFLYSRKIKFASQKTQSVVTQTQSSPEPSSQTLNKAQWTLEVLNGSTKKGAAAALAEKLAAKGYQIIKTGNAEKDSATSQVFFSDSKKDQAGLFLEDIKEELPNPTDAGSLKDSTASARIIIGEE